MHSVSGVLSHCFSITSLIAMGSYHVSNIYVWRSGITHISDHLLVRFLHGILQFNKLVMCTMPCNMNIVNSFCYLTLINFRAAGTIYVFLIIR